MFKGAVSQLADRCRQSFERWIARRVLFLTDEARRLATEGPKSRVVFIDVIGREHYRERHRLVPLARWADAWAVARVECAAVPGSMYAIGPYIEGQRRLTFFEPTSEAVIELGSGFFRLPETLVLAGALPKSSLGVIERSSIRYFLSDLGDSQREGGLLKTPQLAAHAMGLKPGWTLESIDDHSIRHRLLEGLKNLRLGSWVTAWSPRASGIVKEIFVPMSVLVGCIVGIYLAIASSYIFGMHSWRERISKDLGTDVSMLLQAQRDIGKFSAEYRAVSSVLSDRPAVYPVWGGIAAAWKAGALISGFTYSERVVTLKGRADSATSVLASISKYPRVSNAVFTSSVRQDGQMQEFSIRFEITPDKVDK